jgi:ring-1,2-phenylacetyl-CoA epoxidase subunit PaaC
MTMPETPGAAPSPAGRMSVDPDGLDIATRTALKTYLLSIADDELLMGHRDAEWTGLGPILEEDIAFSSMAQDELGHALVWYTLVSRLGEAEPNQLAFRRGASAFRNAILAELPRGDYATSLVRQYLHDLAEAVRYDALARSTWTPIAEAAVKLRQEEKYHLIHGRIYLERLARATIESRARIQAALDALFPYALGLWEPIEGEPLLVACGLVPASAACEQVWLDALTPFLVAAGLSIIFISHKLAEVMNISDRILVLGAGRLAGERRTAETTRHELAGRRSMPSWGDAVACTAPTSRPSWPICSACIAPIRTRSGSRSRPRHRPRVFRRDPDAVS